MTSQAEDLPFIVITVKIVSKARASQGRVVTQRGVIKTIILQTMISSREINAVDAENKILNRLRNSIIYKEIHFQLKSIF